jgi:hypothetical protein
MSQRNGDKSRFGQERRQKIFRRKRIRELRKALESKASKPSPVAPEVVGVASLAIATIG